MTQQSTTARLAAFELPPGGRRRPERIDELLTELGKYWHGNPDLRLGQIVDNFADALARAYGYTHTEGAARQLEDDALIELLRTEQPWPNLAASRYLTDSTGDEPLRLQLPPWHTAKQENRKPSRIRFWQNRKRWNRGVRARGCEKRANDWSSRV